LLQPYFRFENRKSDDYPIDDTRFITASMLSMERYRDLASREYISSLFLIGAPKQPALEACYEYASRTNQEAQNNQSHIVELYAAMAGIRSLTMNVDDGAKPQAYYFQVDRSTENLQKPWEWDDLNQIDIKGEISLKTRLQQYILFYTVYFGYRALFKSKGSLAQHVWYDQFFSRIGSQETVDGSFREFDNYFEDSRKWLSEICSLRNIALVDKSLLGEDTSDIDVVLKRLETISNLEEPKSKKIQEATLSFNEAAIVFQEGLLRSVGKTSPELPLLSTSGFVASLYQVFISLVK
jgi:hypothetical protein